MNNCPTCGEILYSVNSSSSEVECLSKKCSYSTISRVGIEFFSFAEEASDAWSVCESEQVPSDSSSPLTPEPQSLF